MSAIKDCMKKESGSTSPFSKKGQDWVEKERLKKEQHESSLHRMVFSSEFSQLRKIIRNKELKGMSDILFVQDYDDKKGKRHIEFAIKRQVRGITAQTTFCLHEKKELKFLIKFLQAAVDGKARRDSLL